MRLRNREIPRGGSLASAWPKRRWPVQEVFPIRDLSARSLTTAYVAALAVIAIMTLGAHLTLNRMIKEHEGAASVVNLSGRQRMLSQRIAGLASQLALDLPGVRSDLVAALDRFEASHRDLVQGNAAAGIPAATDPALHAIYFEGPTPLDATVIDFVTRGRRLAQMKADEVRRSDDLARIIAAAREPLLAALNSVVTYHQQSSERALLTLERMQNGSLAVVLLTLLIEALLIFRPMVLRIAAYTRALLTLATVDPLTQALNRRSFNDRAAAELARARRYGRTTAMLLLDADRFKAVNDTHGHAAGDAVLQALSATVAAALRPSDLFGRLGGEEFGVLLSETGGPGAVVAAERIRQAVADLRVLTAGGPLAFTISIGVAEVAENETAVQAAMARADLALYQAKAAGRNRVVLAASAESADHASSLQTV